MEWKKQIPNTLTAMNLIAGLVAITFVLEERYPLAGLFILIAALFDYLDGAVARWLDAYSELGRQLDSLADLVSFGVAPGLLMFSLISMGCDGSCNILEQLHITPYFALLIPVCAAFRLAKFNIDLRQTVHFIGLPTPGNALFFASIPLILYPDVAGFSIFPMDFLHSFFLNTRVLTILVVLFSYLMISDFRMFSLKFRSKTWRGNELRYLFLMISALLLVLFSVCAIPFIILIYFLFSLLFQRRIISDE